MPRVQVIRALGRSNVALSAYAIHDAIQKFGGRIDVVSVYRIVATLEAVDLIHHVGVVDGYLACRLHREQSHHTEHIVDKNTNVVLELELPADAVKAIEKQLGDTKFKPENIKVEIVGEFTS